MFKFTVASYFYEDNISRRFDDNPFLKLCTNVHSDSRMSGFHLEVISHKVKITQAS